MHKCMRKYVRKEWWEDQEDIIIKHTSSINMKYSKLIPFYLYT